VGSDAPSFPSSLAGGRAGWRSSRALAVSIHCWFGPPVETSSPSPALCCVSTRNDLGLEGSTFNSERRWAGPFQSPCFSLSCISLLSPVLAFWIPVELLYVGFHGEQEQQGDAGRCALISFGRGL